MIEPLDFKVSFSHAREERPVVYLIKSIQAITDLELYEDPNEYAIGDDYVQGPIVADMLVSLLGLLDFETGRIDCGRVDNWVRETAAVHNLVQYNDLLSR